MTHDSCPLTSTSQMAVACTHTHILHRYIQTYIHAYTYHSYRDTPFIQAYIHTHIIHIYRQAGTYTPYIQTDIHTYIYTYHTYKQTYAYHTYIQTHTHHTYRHSYIHTHTPYIHIQTHTQSRNGAPRYLFEEASQNSLDEDPGAGDSQVRRALVSRSA